jgi:hypothetical protein
MNPPQPATSAFLALWNDIDPSRIDEYERWHTLEHVPERVWTPGCIAGTRYVATRPGQPRYFTLYDLACLSALEMPAYQDLVDHPTAWSASMRPAFHHFLRKPCNRVAVEGVTQGAALLVLRMALPDGTDDAAITRGVRRVLADGVNEIVTRVTAGRAGTAGPQAMQNQDEGPAGDECIVLVEAADPERLPAVEALALAVFALTPSHSDAGAPARGSAAPRDGAGHDLASYDRRPHDRTAHHCTSHDRASRCSASHYSASHYRYISRVLHADVAGPVRPAPRTDAMPPVPSIR